LELNYFGLQDRFYWQLAPGYELAERRANTGLIGIEGPEGTIQDDVSYDRDLYSLIVGFFWNRTKHGAPVRRADGIRLILAYSETDYITDNLDDLDRYGREDDYWSVGLEYIHTILGDLRITGYARYAEKDSNLEVIQGIDRLEPSQFDNFIIGFKLDWYLGWKSRAK
jgi:hypothetical protein